MATLRARTIKNVCYDLTFDIPADKKTPVAGTLILSFYLPQKIGVTLDFEGRFSGACLINGKKRVATMRNKHIFIPEKHTKKGLNTIEMNFVSKEKCFYRGNGYLLTITTPDMARSCFPCFDQPDINATFTTQMNLPSGWQAMTSSDKTPMPVNAFNFVAGQFEETKARKSNHDIRLLYREQEPQRLRQLPKMIDEAAAALRWMASYTGIGYPQQELTIVILPGYGADHMVTAGGMMLSAQRAFLRQKAPSSEQWDRMALIAHGTVHQWFGSMVNFKGADREWAMETIANFLASKITRTQFAKTDITLNLMKHDKVPVMMQMLEDVTGEKELQKGLQSFLRQYYRKEASWNDLTAMLDQENPAAGVSAFNELWAKEKGMPVIHTAYNDGILTVTQTDPSGQGRFWRQKFDIRIINDLDRSRTINIDMTQPVVKVKLARQPSSIIPNYSGRGYGHFTLSKDYSEKLPLRLIVTRGETERYALLLTLFDNYKMGRIPPTYFGELYRLMQKERNAVIIDTAIDHMFEIAFRHPYAERNTLEQCIMDLLPENHSVSCRLAILRKLGANAQSPEVLAQLYQIWDTQSDKLLDEEDYMQIAYRLAITHPGQWETIIEQQRNRMRNEYLKQEFDFVSKACSPSEQVQRNLFNNMLKAENRKNEWWALEVIRLLNADVREPQSDVYIDASIQSMPYLQQTSDNRFADRWMQTLLSRHRCKKGQTFIRN